MYKIKPFYYAFNAVAFSVSLLLSLMVSIHFLWLLLPVIPLTIIGIYDLLQTKHTILRNFPVIGHFRYLLLKIRPEIHQYFIEGNTNGSPFSYEKRSLIYQRAKKVRDTLPFGTQVDVGRIGYEWINHSLLPQKVPKESFYIDIGGDACTNPYKASLLNISAMSFGALSRNAVMALNRGARLGGFAHNTGEGGISAYHLEGNGDLIWQIGTAYFGCRDKKGNFDSDLFVHKSSLPQVKMIELKISQGAKPGKGGILPGVKVTEEIAAIRGLQPGKTIISPASHSAFSTPIEMMQFVKQLRDLSGGKPVGLKLCFGKRREMYSICKAMLKTNICPDYIAVDGGQGGSGSAPLEFSNSVGTPITEGLIDLENALIGFGLRDKIKLIASGKISTGFDIVKLLAFGADACYSARAFMISMGCIQALMCNTDHCPVGVTTQKKQLYKGLHVENKQVRVANYHHETLASVAEIIGAASIPHPSKLKRWHILKRIAVNVVRNYGDLFPYVENGSFLQTNPPEAYKRVLKSSSVDTFDSVLH